MPTAVMNDRPSGAMARPSSSVGPEVICSGRSSVSRTEKRWRHAWNALPALELKYIHTPSGDQPANQHAASGGPTWRPGELASIGTRRHGVQAPRSFISATSAQRPSGEGYDRCAIAPFGIGT